MSEAMSSHAEPEPANGAELQVPSLVPGAPTVVIEEGRYLVRWAHTPEDLARALKLRYEVFNLELGEGLEESHVSGRDEDAFDAGCHHLIVEDTKTNEIIGTYRMQTRSMAERNGGFYSDGEFELEGLTQEVLDDSVEIGRACVALEHRKQRVLFGLWKGLAAYMMHMQKRYLFGCCSLTSQDPHEGRAVLQKLAEDGLLYNGLSVEQLPVAPRPHVACVDPDTSPIDTKGLKLPTLFGTYLRFGALVCSPPAIDREFKTIDFLVVMDTATLPARTRATFFGD